MTWPGTPKSQQTPPINQPSTRFPFSLNENSTMSDVADAMRNAFNGLTVHEQAFANLPAQIAAQAKTAATQTITEIVSNETVTGVTSFNALTGAVIYFPGLGQINDQLGEPSYTTQQSDSSLGVVRPDEVTIGVNSGTIFTIGATGTIPLGPVTDSGATGSIFVSQGLITGWVSPT
jgi:hypothetical protein